MSYTKVNKSTDDNTGPSDLLSDFSNMTDKTNGIINQISLITDKAVKIDEISHIQIKKVEI